MSLKFDQIRSWTAELAALEPLEKSFIIYKVVKYRKILTKYNVYLISSHVKISNLISSHVKI